MTGVSSEEKFKERQRDRDKEIGDIVESIEPIVRGEQERRGFHPPYMLFSLLLAFAGEPHSALPTGAPHDTLYVETRPFGHHPPLHSASRADGFTWEHMLNLGWYGTEADRGEPHAHRLPTASSVELSLAAGLWVGQACKVGRASAWKHQPVAGSD